MKHILFVFCLAMLCVKSVNSQPRLWQLTLLDGTVVSQVELLSLKHDSLYFADKTGIQVCSVESIVEIKHVRQGSFWKGAKKGAKIGSATGGVIGIIVGLHAKPSPGTLFGDVDKTTLRIFTSFLGAVSYGIILGIVCGTIGGINSGIAIDEIYDLSKLSLQRKLVVIHNLLASYKNDIQH